MDSLLVTHSLIELFQPMNQFDTLKNIFDIIPVI